MDVETEITELKRRVGVLETEVEADHHLSVRLFQYVRETRDDVAMVRSHAVVTDRRIEHVEGDLAKLRSEFDTFRKEFPGLVADAMREVLREFRGS
jgi:hypothetical protein